MMFLAPNGRVQVMRAATGQVFHRHHNFFATGFDWRPDGHRMVYASRGGDLFLILPKNRTPRRILRTRARESSPVWSPDMEQIAFVRGRSVFTMDVPDGTPRRVLRVEGGADDQLAAAPLTARASRRGAPATRRAARGSGG